MTDIITEFKKKAIIHGNAILQGDYKLANTTHTYLMNLSDKIIQTNKWDELKELTNDENESVILWAATFILKHDSTFALNVLTRLAASQQIFGLTASTTIDQ